MIKLALFLALFFIFNVSNLFAFSYKDSSWYEPKLIPNLGSRVNFDSHVGYVNKFLPDNDVEIRLLDSNQYVVKKINEIGIEVELIEGIWPGMMASFHSQAGTVEAVFSNYNVIFHPYGQSERIIKKLSEISPELEQPQAFMFQGIWKGDRVIVENFEGVVTNIFVNGNVEIQIKDKDTYYTIYRYFKELTKLDYFK